MGPKPVASEDQTGFSPDDWKCLELNYFYIHVVNVYSDTMVII